jgi:hypothetical protein
MKLCIVGIGGAGGKVTQEFLGNDDLDWKWLSRMTKAEYISPGRIKGIWLEADKNDAKNIQSFFGDLNEGAYPGFFIPHDAVQDGSRLHVLVREKYGYDVKKQGFVRDAQYLKAIFEIFDTDEEIQRIAAEMTSGAATQALSGVLDEPKESSQGQKVNNNYTPFRQNPNPIFDGAWDVIRPYTTLGGGECDGILFIVSFGGGTGTGFINPIINHIRNEGKGDYPVFVLGILTEMGDFADRSQFSKEGRRNLAAISAIYDLLTKSNGANGVILVDNQTMMERFGHDYATANKFIFEIMQPMVAARDYPGEVPPSQAIAQHFSGGLSRPPLFVPLYWSQARGADPEEELVRNALFRGKLFGCAPDKADWAAVFCRGFIDSEKIRQALSAQTGLMPQNIWVLRKMGEKDDEILIMLRNPYGSDPEAHRKEGTLENRFCKVITLALQYMNQNVEDLFYEGKEMAKPASAGKEESIKLTPLAKGALSRFFFGPEGFIKDNFGKNEGFAFELREARWRLRAGEKPFFHYPRKIFEKVNGKDEGKEVRQEAFGLDEQRIMEIVNKRVDQRLAEMGLIKGG